MGLYLGWMWRKFLNRCFKDHLFTLWGSIDETCMRIGQSGLCYIFINRPGTFAISPLQFEFYPRTVWSLPFDNCVFQDLRFILSHIENQFEVVGLLASICAGGDDYRFSRSK